MNLQEIETLVRFHNDHGMACCSLNTADALELVEGYKKWAATQPHPASEPDAAMHWMDGWTG